MNSVLPICKDKLFSTNHWSQYFNSLLRNSQIAVGSFPEATSIWSSAYCTKGSCTNKNLSKIPRNQWNGGRGLMAKSEFRQIFGKLQNYRCYSGYSNMHKYYLHTCIDSYLKNSRCCEKIPSTCDIWTRFSCIVLIRKCSLGKILKENIKVTQWYLLFSHYMSGPTYDWHRIWISINGFYSV